MYCRVVFCGVVWGVDPQAFPNDGEGNFASLMVLNKQINVCLGWDECLGTGCVVSCKILMDEGFQTFESMIG
jgi:hypothetical protein